MRESRQSGSEGWGAARLSLPLSQAGMTGEGDPPQKEMTGEGAGPTQALHPGFEMQRLTAGCGASPWERCWANPLGRC